MSMSDWLLIARWIGYLAVFVQITRRVLKAKPTDSGTLENHPLHRAGPDDM